MKTRTLLLVVTLLTGLFVMTDCNDDNDQYVCNSTVVGKWRLVSSGPFEIGDKYRQELSFDTKGYGTFYSDKDGKVQKETFIYKFVEGDYESAYKKYLRIYSKYLSIDRQFTGYHWDIEGDILLLDERGVKAWVGATQVYKRVR